MGDEAPAAAAGPVSPKSAAKKGLFSGSKKNVDKVLDQVSGRARPLRLRVRPSLHALPGKPATRSSPGAQCVRACARAFQRCSVCLRASVLAV
jgi:hypothetical protein